MKHCDTVIVCVIVALLIFNVLLYCSSIDQHLDENTPLLDDNTALYDANSTQVQPLAPPSTPPPRVPTSEQGMRLILTQTLRKAKLPLRLARKPIARENVEIPMLNESTDESFLRSLTHHTGDRSAVQGF